MSDFKENLLDFITAIGIACALLVGLLAYFDVLVK